ncbi:MAG: FecR domain-containing protein [Hyphomicrobiales bacterium]|nr:FecR domain-containing protein [Hyphomicrobiales bacterium]
MNYSGTFDFGLLGVSPNGIAQDGATVSSIPHSSPSSSIVVDDAQLLFGGDFTRSGVDLVLSRDGHDHVVPDYFKGSQRAALKSPDGAMLSPDLIKALVGEVQLAQAGGAANAAATVIGTVSKLTGSATAIRNGVSVMLNVGDPVQKGDVVQAGAASSLNLTFIDGSVFGLSANARMVLNEMVYDPQGSSNSSLLSLIQGTVAFVAGETAKNGDMRVDTPVATMGIRGTAVLVEIGFEVPGQGGAPPVKFQVLVEPGGKVGSYVLYSKTGGQIIGTVNESGQVTSVTGLGDTTTGPADPLTPIAQAVIQQTLLQYFPNYIPNANPRSNGSGGGSAPGDPNSGTSPDPLQFLPPPDVLPGQPLTVPINLPGDPPGTPPINVIITRFNTAPTIVVAPVTVLLPVDQTSFTIADQVVITDPDSGDIATPYVPGTARIISATGPSGTPSNLDLKTLVTVDAQTGQVSYDPAAFKFLALGQTAVYTIAFESRSGPDTTQQTIVFTVDGSNDAPTVALALTGTATQGNAVQSFDLLAGASDPDLGETATLTIGNLAFKLNGGPVQSAPAGVTLNGTALLVDPTAFAYLGAGQIATITVTYSIIDAHGATVPQTETITVTGVNDGPVLVAAGTTTTATLDANTATAQGAIKFSDIDTADSHTATVSPEPGVIGTLTLGTIDDTTGVYGKTGTVNWSYTVDPGQLAGALIAAGGTLIDTFTVSISDGQGGTLNEDITVTVGANIWQGGGSYRTFGPTTSGSSSDWGTPGNWSNGVPNGSQFVLINQDANINLDENAQVGTLLIAPGASVVLTTSGGPHHLDVTNDVFNYGDVTLAPGTTLHVGSDVHNYGQLTIDNHATGSTLLIGDVVHLDGGGTVTLDGTADRITGETFNSSFINVDNKIDGYGKIGDGQLTLVNGIAGIIAATDFWHGLTINTGHGTFTNDGLVVSASLFGGLKIDGDVLNNGTLEARLGLLKVDGAVTGGGHAVIDGGNLQFGGASNAHVLFSGNTADLLKLDNVWQFKGTVTGFSFGDTIDLTGVSWWNVRLVDMGDWIKVRYGSAAHDYFRIDGDYATNKFLVTTDFHGGTAITWLDQAPQIETDQIQIHQTSNATSVTTTISGLSMFDTDAGRRETFSFKVNADGQTIDSGSGRLSTVDGELGHGFTYTQNHPTATSVGKVAVTVTDSYGASDTVNVIFSTSNAATSAPVTLTGTAGKDVILASSHNDTLSGGAAADQFVFKTPSGQDVITDFTPGQDKIELDFAPPGNNAFQNWLACHATQQGADTLITFGTNDSLLLKHVALSDLHTSDFIVGSPTHAYAA